MAVDKMQFCYDRFYFVTTVVAKKKCCCGRNYPALCIKSLDSPRKKGIEKIFFLIFRQSHKISPEIP